MRKYNEYFRVPSVVFQEDTSKTTFLIQTTTEKTYNLEEDIAEGLNFCEFFIRTSSVGAREILTREYQSSLGARSGGQSVILLMGKFRGEHLGKEKGCGSIYVTQGVEPLENKMCNIGERIKNGKIVIYNNIIRSNIGKYAERSGKYGCGRVFVQGDIISSTLGDSASLIIIDIFGDIMNSEIAHSMNSGSITIYADPDHGNLDYYRRNAIITEPIIRKNHRTVKNSTIGSFMRGGSVKIYGNVEYGTIGNRMKAGEITITGDVIESQIGEGMSGGKIEVQGKYIVGNSHNPESFFIGKGMSGGSIIINEVYGGINPEAQSLIEQILTEAQILTDFPRKNIGYNMTGGTIIVNRYLRRRGFFKPKLYTKGFMIEK